VWNRKKQNKLPDKMYREGSCEVIKMDMCNKHLALTSLTLL